MKILRIFREDRIDMVYKRCVVVANEDEELCIVCNPLEVEPLEKKLGSLGLLGKITIIPYANFDKSTVQFKPYIFFNTDINKYAINDIMEENIRSLTVITDEPIGKVMTLKNSLQGTYLTKVYGENVLVSNESTKEMEESKRLVADTRVRKRYLNKLGLTSYEITDCVSCLINRSKYVLVIACPWWNDSCYIYIAAIVDALERGVNVTIYFGIGDSDERKSKTLRTINHLKSVCYKYDNINFVEIVNHSAVIVSDRFYLNSSKNFMSVVDEYCLDLGELQEKESKEEIDKVIKEFESWRKND